MSRSHVNALLLLLIVIMAVTAWLSRQRPPDHEPLTTLAEAEINRIEWQVDDGVPTVLIRTRAGWLLQSPVRIEAEPAAVDALLRIAAQPAYRHFDAAEVPLADMGLDPPRMRLRFEQVEIALGSIDPVTFRRYVRVGDRVAQIEDPAGLPSDGDLGALVARQLLTRPDQLRALELPGLRLVRGEDGWQAEPEAAAPGGDERAAWIEAWRDARALWVSAGHAAEPGDTRIVIDYQDGHRQVLQVVAREPLLVLAGGQGLHWHLPRNQAELLLPAVDDAQR